jgi:hypothetical protein
MGVAAVILVVGVEVVLHSADSTGSSTTVATATDAPAPIMETSQAPAPDEATPAPTPRPTSYAQYQHEQKREFMATVDESISGGMIVGNKFKYVGKSVDLHCTVENIPDQSWFNANCSGDDDDPAMIVIEYDTHDLSPGQAIRVMGTVDQPMEGNNAMGGDATFPTIKAEFME